MGVEMTGVASGSNSLNNRSSNEITNVKKLRELNLEMREMIVIPKPNFVAVLGKWLPGSAVKSRRPKRQTLVSVVKLQNLKQKIILLLDAEPRDEIKQELKELKHLLIEIQDNIEEIQWKSGTKVVRGAIPQYFLEKIERFLSIVANNLTWDKECLSPRKPLPKKEIPPSSLFKTEGDKLLRHDQKEEIKKLLLTAQASTIITIWGPRGLGKTTLLKNLYNNDINIRRHFQSFAWVQDMPNQDFQGRNIMQSILLQLLPSTKKQVTEMSVVELIEELHRVQKDRICLIVLSDVSRDNWVSLRTAFPPSHRTRSQIMLTTCDKDFAEEIGEAQQIYPLDQKQSLELFRSRTDFSFGEDTEKKWMEIVSQCKGSGLMIAILAGYVNSTSTSSLDCERYLADYLHSHLTKQQSDFEETAQSIVSLSYSKLLSELQKCFLYLAHFPLERKIQVDELYVRWIDEGLISKSEEKSKMEVAQDYLEELALRNLVEMLEEEQEPNTGSSKSCKLHPLVRDFCIAEAYRSTPSHHVSMCVMVPKLPINYKTYQTGYPSNRSCLRSLTFFATCEPPPEVVTSKQQLVDFTELDSLRLLEFDGVDFRGWKLPKGIGGELICLKHLSFKRCYLENLPASIGQLSHLKTLNLQVEAHCRMSIPNVLWKLTKLKHLYFPARFECADKPGGKLSLRSLEALEILVNFNAQVCDALDLGVMKKLQNVGAIVEQSHEDLQIILRFLTKRVFTDLRDSSLDIRNFNCFSEEKRGVLETLLGCQPLCSLRLEGYIKKWPKEGEITRLGQNLTEIVLSGAELEADPMPRFGQLPNLRSLALCNDAYIGKEMECSGFLQLRGLRLTNLRCLETWSVGEGAMPKLMSLSIEKCVNLAMLPAGLKSLVELREVKIVSMPTEFEARLQVIDGKQGEDVGKVNKVPRIIIICSDS